MTLWPVAEIWESCSRLMLLTIWCPFVEMMLWGNFLLQGKVVVSFSCLKMIDSWLRHCEDLKWRYFILSGSCSLAFVAVADIFSCLGRLFSTGSLLEFKIHCTVWTHSDSEVHINGILHLITFHISITPVCFWHCYHLSVTHLQ